MYLSNLTDKDWDLIKDYLFPTIPVVVNLKHEKSFIVNAVFT